ncbi:uncharacterized protein HKW66_Vig0164480 [Vigna angularis]|uniref:NAD(P)-binding domain-containing protein n=1 Tax=Phaseolus angularis TaxID=3914 RepID=A0A8T0JRV5_PHAAN|nr:uncharacterized protein HKW66_Vig0164480 [Vigna angularis]
MNATASATAANSSFYSQTQCRLSSDIRGSIPFSKMKRFLFFNDVHPRNSPLVLVPRAADPNTGKDSNVGDDEVQKQQRVMQQPPMSLSLDDVNPVGLGRKSRQLFDEVWRKFSGLGQISRTIRSDDQEALDALLVREGPMCEFAIPGAQNTTVLVVGATSRIGRIVVRKLMLRGYTVKALVRKADQEVVDLLPRSVEIVIGDVGDPTTVKAAVEGCNKIIYCATARSAITGDLFRVDHRGVYNLTKAFQDHNNKLAQSRAGKSSKSKLLIAKFKSESSLHGWEVRQGTYFQDVLATKYDGGMDAKFEFTENGDAVFSANSTVSGTHHRRCLCRRRSSRNRPRTTPSESSRPGDHRGAKIVVNGPPTRCHAPPQQSPVPPLPAARAGASPESSAVDQDRGDCLLALFLDLWSLRQSEHFGFLGFLPLHGVFLVYKHLYWYEGLVLSVGGNGRSYVLIVEAGPSADPSQSRLYFARISTKVGFCRVRVPFSSFRPVKPDDPLLDPFLVHTLTIRFEPRRQKPVEVNATTKQDLRSFKLILEYIKALPAGEDSLRRSGLGYTIVRPGPLQEEPGGQRALIFDQGNRISQKICITPVAKLDFQGISCADVADICVKALHDTTARNKSFDVCYEYIAEDGRELYELVAHLPDKANNYLTPALSVLEKNT